MQVEVTGEAIAILETAKVGFASPWRLDDGRLEVFVDGVDVVATLASGERRVPRDLLIAPLVEFVRVT
jgi:hypothetical protein